MGVFDYKRRNSTKVDVAGVTIGKDSPIVIQSMTNTSTNDIEASVNQIIEINRAGAPLVRLTAQGIREVESLARIKEQLKCRHHEVPLVADIHFNAAAAFAAAEVVDKVRINPGNFVDPGRIFKQTNYTDQEYSAELDRLRQKVTPFFELCKKNNVAVRIGVNHGSLSDRIMSRYGNTPRGMVESAMEFLRIAALCGFNNIIISMKSSNTRIMVEAVRRLNLAMKAEGMSYPLHLGVTEAGAGEDGRIKSAIGIGTLLSEGLGDTIRVSLSEAPRNEIPVAREIIDYIQQREGAGTIVGEFYHNFDKVNAKRRKTFLKERVGFQNHPLVVVEGWDEDANSPTPDFTSVDDFIKMDASEDDSTIIKTLKENPDKILLVHSNHKNRIGQIKRFIHFIENSGFKNPVIVELDYPDNIEKWQVVVRASIDFGSLLMDNLIDGLKIDSNILSKSENASLAFGILQGTGDRFTKTEYIACPGCGRTMFDLETTLQQVREATIHLKGLKIGVMGCIVNGPGEMAGADYGYVGAAKGKISLYRGLECVKRNIPQEEAVEQLIDLLKTDGVWKEK